MECEICDAINTSEIVKETKYWSVNVSDNQSYLGRCYVCLKRHCGSLSELKQAEWLDIIELIKKLESALKKAFSATMFNWTCLMNNAYKKNPPNPHVHWHFKPRYNHEVEFAGLVFEDKEFAHHYSSERKQEVSAEVKKKIAQKIRESL